MGKKPAAKVGVRGGEGPPSGYKWGVDVLKHGLSELTVVLDKAQLAHVTSQVLELATEDDPTESSTIDLRPVDEFYEIRDKGGILKKLNIRLFFCLCKEQRTIVVLGAFNKKNDAPTPEHVRILMRYRMRRYLEEVCNE